MEMEISHHLLWGLTTLNLTPLNRIARYKQLVAGIYFPASLDETL